MDIVVYSQFCCIRTPERQLEVAERLRRNLNLPGLSRMALVCESDAPPAPEGTPRWATRYEMSLEWSGYDLWKARQRLDHCGLVPMELKPA